MNENDSLEPVPEQEMKTITGGGLSVPTNRRPQRVNISIPDEEAIFRGSASDTELLADMALIVDIKS